MIYNDDIDLIKIKCKVLRHKGGPGIYVAGIHESNLITSNRSTLYNPTVNYEDLKRAYLPDIDIQYYELVDAVLIIKQS